MTQTREEIEAWLKDAEVGIEEDRYQYGCAALLAPALSVIRQLLDQTAWRPIVEAPTDGTEILLTNGKEVIIGWFSRGEWTGGCYGEYSEVSEEIEIDKPTHWMPLPSVPTEDKK